MILFYGSLFKIILCKYYSALSTQRVAMPIKSNPTALAGTRCRLLEENHDSTGTEGYHLDLSLSSLHHDEPIQIQIILKFSFITHIRPGITISLERPHHTTEELQIPTSISSILQRLQDADPQCIWNLENSAQNQFHSQKNLEKTHRDFGCAIRARKVSSP